MISSVTKIFINGSIAAMMVSMLLLSCGDAPATHDDVSLDTIATKTSINLKSLESENGQKKYRFETPLFEEFDQAALPYIEMKKGVKVEMFGADSVTIEKELVANYARYDKKSRIWEVRGNVIAKSYKEDRVLYTELLYWDETRKKIFTPKPAKMVDAGKVHYGVGFESDEKFEVWQFNNARGQIEIQDSTKKEQ